MGKHIRLLAQPLFLLNSRLLAHVRMTVRYSVVLIKSQHVETNLGWPVADPGIVHDIFNILYRYGNHMTDSWHCYWWSTVDAAPCFVWCFVFVNCLHAFCSGLPSMRLAHGGASSAHPWIWPVVRGPYLPRSSSLTLAGGRASTYLVGVIGQQHALIGNLHTLRTAITTILEETLFLFSVAFIEFVWVQKEM